MEEEEGEAEVVHAPTPTSPPPILHAVTEEDAPPTTARAEAVSAGERVTGYPPSGGPNGGESGEVEEEEKEELLAGISVMLGVVMDTKEATGLAPKPLQNTSKPNTPPPPSVVKELKRHLRV